jgi:hypothetical protein
MQNLWRQRDPDLTGSELVGFVVHASDGVVGVVDEATLDAPADSLVVRCGRWRRRSRVLLPTHTIDWVDSDRGMLLASKSREQIRNGPGFDAPAPEVVRPAAVRREPAIARESAAS